MSSREFPGSASEQQGLLLSSQAEASQPGLRPCGGKRRAFFPTRSLPIIRKHEGTALFYVNNSSIEHFLGQKLQSYQAQTYILDQNGAVVTTSGNTIGCAAF